MRYIQTMVRQYDHIMRDIDLLSDLIDSVTFGEEVDYKHIYPPAPFQVFLFFRLLEKIRRELEFPVITHEEGSRFIVEALKHYNCFRVPNYVEDFLLPRHLLELKTIYKKLSKEARQIHDEYYNNSIEVVDKLWEQRRYADLQAKRHITETS